MPVNNLYYNKYLKYKNKYLNLQSQIGGVRYTGVDNVRQPLIAPVNARSPRPLPAPSDSVPLIERQKSTFISCQGSEATCWAHATTRLIMKLITNFFSTYFPLHINDCNYYYNTIACSNDKTNIFDCFLQIKKGELDCNNYQSDKKEIKWAEENCYALLFHFIFSTLVEQYGREDYQYASVTCLYILDYLKHIDITNILIKKRLKYNAIKYNDSEIVYFTELILKSVMLFKDVKESLNNEIFNPIIYLVDNFKPVSNVVSISKYQYYTKDFDTKEYDTKEYDTKEYDTKEYDTEEYYREEYDKILPPEKISFKGKLEQNIPFSSEISNLKPEYTDEHNLKNLTGTTDLPTNIKYVLKNKYYAIFTINEHMVTITDYSGDTDNLFLHIKNSWGIDTCNKEKEKTWCNLINDNKISINKLLLTWDRDWDIVFFYPENYKQEIINKFHDPIINFRNENISDYKGKEIAGVLMENTTLKQLHFLSCNISDNAIKEIAGALMINRTIAILYFNDCNISKDGIIAITELLKNNSTLTQLIFWQNNIGDNEAKEIAEALKINKTLKIISLSINKIGDAGAIAIAEALKTNKTLTEIYLSNNKIGDAGAIAIAEALKTHTTIKLVNLNSNKIGDVGAKAIAEAFKKNTKLKEIQLYGNTEISSEIKAEIKKDDRIKIY
jgi:hypothetical protein